MRLTLIELVKRLGSRAITRRNFACTGVSPGMPVNPSGATENFAHTGVRLRQVAETTSNLAALEFVREGLGVTLFTPIPSLSSGFEGIVVRPIDAVIHYQTSFVLPPVLSPYLPATQFMQFVKRTTPEDKYSELA